MQHKVLFIEPLLERVEEYGKTSLELLKLNVLCKSSRFLASFISNATFTLVFAMFMVIATIGVALWLGDILGKSYYGFFCVAGFYAILGGVLYLFMKNYGKKRITNSIITHLS